MTAQDRAWRRDEAGGLKRFGETILGRRPIINTGGKGLVASDALKASLGALAVAIVVLLIFYFLNSAGLDRPAKPAAWLPAPVRASIGLPA